MFNNFLVIGGVVEMHTYTSWWLKDVCNLPAQPFELIIVRTWPVYQKDSKFAIFEPPKSRANQHDAYNCHRYTRCLFGLHGWVWWRIAKPIIHVLWKELYLLELNSVDRSPRTFHIFLKKRSNSFHGPSRALENITLRMFLLDEKKVVNSCYILTRIPQETLSLL